MTDPLFFDTDCISAFLWVNNESIVARLYSKRIIIPKQVYDELSNPSIQHLKQKLDALINAGEASVMQIDIESDAYNIYLELTSHPQNGHMVIGRGEAAAISLAKTHSGILASNNLKDISQYVKEYGLINLTTGDILKEALNQGIISEAQGNAIWANMLRKRRKLGYSTFSDYLQSKIE